MSNIDKQALEEKTREAFELWAEQSGALPWGILKKHRNEDGGYPGPHYTYMWHAWNACHEALLDELEDYKAAYEEESREKDVQRSVIDDALCNLLPGCQYMDLPDGGSVTPLEQVSRMIAEYREKLQVAEKRIAELEAREVRLPELCVGVVQGGHAVMVPYAAGHWFNKTAILEMLADAGINVVAASGKGEAS
ncbi:hypothetical protein [Enterobacter ludwigii]